MAEDDEKVTLLIVGEINAVGYANAMQNVFGNCCGTLRKLIVPGNGKAMTYHLGGPSPNFGRDLSINHALFNQYFGTSTSGDPSSNVFHELDRNRVRTSEGREDDGFIVETMLLELCLDG